MIEKSLIGLWEGIGNPKHYNAACDVEDYIGLIPIGDGMGVVIGEDISRSTWISYENNEGGFLLVLNYIKEGMKADTIIERILSIDESLFEKTGLQVKINDNSIYLFAACDNGPNWMYERSENCIIPGVYDIYTLESYSFDDCSFRVHRFKKEN